MENKTFKKVSVFKLSADIREAVKVVEVPLMKPSDDEILVKNLYSGVNATDINITAGRNYFDGKLPFDIGLEGLGVIEAIGKDVVGLEIGQKGLVFAVPPKAYSEYLYIKRNEFIALPDDRPQYLALLDCGLTATIGLDQAGRITKGEKVLITAAAGGTGHIAVQWAKLKGCHVIGLCSSQKKVELLKELGCDRVINYKEENIDEVLSREFPEGIDVIWETIGGSVLETLFKHLSIGGRLIIVGGITGYKTVGFPDVSIPNLPTKLLTKSQSLIGFRFRHFSHLFNEYLKNLIELYSNNKLKIIIDFGQNSPNGPFEGIDAVVKGVEHLHSGQNIGKVIVKIDK
jgi:NADPH-dependent curcumin reductase CurA